MKNICINNKNKYKLYYSTIFLIFFNIIYNLHTNNNVYATNKINTKEKKIKKSRFTTEEDKNLKRFVLIYGKKNWHAIAKNMPNRNERQCRERYINYLDSNVNRNPWTEEEDELLISKYQIYGPKWKLISQYFKNRTNINIKNRFTFLIRNQKLQIKNEQQTKGDEQNLITQPIFYDDDFKFFYNLNNKDKLLPF